MLEVKVTLLSGRKSSFSISQSSKVGDLRILAERSLRQGFLRLVSAEGRDLVDPTETLSAVGFRPDHIYDVTGIAQEAKLLSTRRAFALWRDGGGIVTWGSKDFGGDSSSVQKQLRNVQQLQATLCALSPGTILVSVVIVLKFKISSDKCEE